MVHLAQYAAGRKKIDVYMLDRGFVKERKRCMKEGLPFPSDALISEDDDELKRLKRRLEHVRKQLSRRLSFQSY